MTIFCSRPNSGTAPPRSLQLNLSLEGFGEVDDQQLNKATAQSDTCKHVEISLGPSANDFDATRGPDLFGGGGN